MNYEMVEIDGDNAEEFSAYIDIDTEDDLNREFFRGLGVVDDSDNPMGALVYELMDLDSEEDTRSRIHLIKGENADVAQSLLTEYADAIQEDEVVESHFETSDQVMSEYLRANGFSVDISEGMDMVVTVDDIKAVPLFAKDRKFPAHIRSLSDITAIQYRAFVKECLFRGHRGLIEDMSYVTKNWFDVEASACIVTDDNVNGVLLVRRSPSGLLTPVLFAAFGADSQQNLALMMNYSAKKVAQLYPGDTRVVIRRQNDTVRQLAGKLFSGFKGEDVYTGSRSEES